MEVRELSDVLIGGPSGEIIDFIKRGFLLMFRLRNNMVWLISSCTDHISNNDVLINYINLSPAMA